MEEQKSVENRPQMSFEDALGRLEQIVQMLEQGQLPLEESMKAFEEGMKLSQICGEKLAQAQSRIEKLTRRPDGTMAWTEQSPQELI